MSDYTPPSGGAVPEYEEMPARSGGGGWFLALVHLAIGGVALGLAVSEDFAEGKAAFASDAWRIVLGAVGAILTFLALRGIARAVAGQTRKLTPDLYKRAKRNGKILLVVGFCLALAATYGDVGEATVAFHSWTRPFFIVGGLYLMLLGLTFQWNPTRTIRQQRVKRGEGRPGVARLLHANDTGMSVNDAPQVKIDFEVDVGGTVHRVSDKIVMQRAHLALLIPGSTVNVLVDKVDPNVFHIDWDSWKPPK